MAAIVCKMRRDGLVFRVLRFAEKHRRGVDNFTKLIGQVAAIEIVARRLETGASLPDGGQSPAYFRDLLFGGPFDRGMRVYWREQVLFRIEEARMRLSVGFGHIERRTISLQTALRQYP